MKLNETIIPIIDQGIFQVLANMGKFDWLTSELAENLDIEYYLNHSGEKSLSPMYEKIIDIWNCGKGTEYLRRIIDNDLQHTTDGSSHIVMTENYKVNPLSAMSAILYHHYHDKWDRIYDAFVASSYKPLENYSMTEEETSASSGSDSRNSKRDSSQTGESKTATDMKTSTNSEVTATDNSKVQTDDSVYGFNSTAAVPSGSSVASGSAADNVKKTSGSAEDNYSHVEGSADSNKTNTAASGTDTETETGSRSDSNDRKLTRSGNIGVTTSQQMLQSELTLRQYDFVKQLFEDADKILTKPMYNY